MPVKRRCHDLAWLNQVADGRWYPMRISDTVCAWFASVVSRLNGRQTRIFMVAIPVGYFAEEVDVRGRSLRFQCTSVPQASHGSKSLIRLIFYGRILALRCHLTLRRFRSRLSLVSLGFYV
jgi:hypothetical protein